MIHQFLLIFANRQKKQIAHFLLRKDGVESSRFSIDGLFCSSWSLKTVLPSGGSSSKDVEDETGDEDSLPVLLPLSHSSLMTPFV